MINVPWRETAPLEFAAVQQPPPPPAPPSPPYGQPPPPSGQPPTYWLAQPQGYMQPPLHRRRKWWLWGCGGCAAFALILGVIAAVVLINAYNGRPLRGFPAEAGASVSDNFQVTTAGSTETLVIDDPHALSDVEAFYQTALPSGGWTVDGADPSNATSGDQWHVTKSGSSKQAGTITFVTTGNATQVTVDYMY
jgi:hypothetical protein